MNILQWQGLAIFSTTALVIYMFIAVFACIYIDRLEAFIKHKELEYEYAAFKVMRNKMRREYGLP